MDISSVATLVLALFTAGLAFFTWRSVDEAGKSRKVWEEIGKDAVRARLDAAAPSVNIESLGVSKNIYWPNGQAIPQDMHWDIALAGVHKIVIRWNLKVSNDSLRPVRIFPKGSFTDQQWFDLAAGSTKELELEAGFTLAQWLENVDAGGLPGPSLPNVAKGSITMSDTSENGVDDTWHLKFTGTPFIPDGYDQGLASLRSRDLAVSEYSWSEVGYRRRTYFLSREQGITLEGPKLHRGL